MRKRIQKEEFSSERRQNTRQRTQDVQRELRGEKSEPKGDRKPFGEKKSFGGERKDFGERKPFNRDGGNGFGKRDDFKKKDFSGNRGERKDFGDKKPFKRDSEDGFQKRDFSENRRERKDFGDKKPFKRDSEGGFERKDSFQKRDFSENRGERKDFGDRKPFKRDAEGGFEKREGFQKRDFSENRGERKDFGDRKPFKRDAEGGFEKREGFQKRDFSENRGERKDFGDRKPFKRDAEGGFEKREGFQKRDFSENRGERKDFGDKKPVRRDAEGTFVKKSFSKDKDSAPKPARKEREIKTIGTAKDNFGGRKLFKSHSRFEESDLRTPEYHIDSFKETAPRKIQKRIEEVEKKSTLVRLNRFIANAGICSRRDADKLIEAGEIKVNGKVITEMGYQVQPTDIVKYGSRKLNREKTVYLLLNKPKDFITTTEDPNDRKTVMELVKNACDSRIYPVGRLDRNTTGLLLLTNDGELAEKLTHPSNEITKVYQVEIDKPIEDDDIKAITEGLKLEDGEIKADELAVITPDKMVLGIKIHSGRNRIVRRIFEHLGYEVLKLDRTSFAGLTKKDLPRGNWRFLTEKEVVKLKYFV